MSNELKTQAAALVQRADDLEALEKSASTAGDFPMARLAQDCARACQRALINVYTAGYNLRVASGPEFGLPF